MDWNDRTLCGPAVNTIKTKFRLDLNTLQSLLKRYTNTLSDQQKFDKFGAIISRLISQRTTSFRSQLGFKWLRKLNVALSRLKEINILNDVETFAGALPDYVIAANANSTTDNKKPPPSSIALLPTKSNFDYLLVRLQSLAQLLLRICLCARSSFELFLDFMNRNFFIETIVIYLAQLSEIWTTARQACQLCIDFYNNIIPFKLMFQQVGPTKWLSENYQFSKKLELFLGDHWTNECNTKLSDIHQNMQSGSLIDLNDFNNDAMVAILTNNDMNQNDSNVNTKKTKGIKKDTINKITLKQNDLPIYGSGLCDIGVAISRSIISTMNTTKAGATVVEENIMQLSDVKKIDNIHKFINNQFEYRRRHNLLNKSLWANLQKKVDCIVKGSQGRHGVELFKRIYEKHLRQYS